MQCGVLSLCHFRPCPKSDTIIPAETLISPDVLLQNQLNQERYALRSLLEFVRILTPDLGPVGIIKSVLRTVMGKSLIKDAFAYLEGESGSATFRLVTKSGFRNESLPASLHSDELLRLTERKDLTVIILNSPDGTGVLGLLAFGASSNPALRVDSEEPYLASLGVLTAIALTNAWLFEREKERERLESELRLAREIQQSLLPQKFPEIVGVEFAAVSRPSEWVGGDYYDVIQLDEHRVMIAIADVVGKGITAALTVSNLQAAIRALVALVRSGQLSLSATVNELNRLMCESTAVDRFVTAIIGVIDFSRSTFEVCVCGHPKPLIVTSDGSVQSLNTTGLPLGILLGADYVSQSYLFPQGAVLLNYTDGFSEAKYEGRMIGPAGIERVVEVVGLLDQALQAGLDRIVTSPQLQVDDDITILAVRRNSSL